MKLTKEKFSNLQVTLGTCPPKNHTGDYTVVMREKTYGQLEISEIIWLELFSGDLNPEDLVVVLQQVRFIVAESALTEKVILYFLDLLLISLASGDYLYWSYSELVWISYTFPECKKLLEGVI